MCDGGPCGGPRVVRLLVPGQMGGLRLDEITARACGMGVSAATELIRFGGVRVGGAHCLDPARRVQSGERLLVRVAARPPEGPEPEIIWEGESVLVVDKPAGIPVQGTREGRSNSLEAFLGRRSAGGWSPRIVHRLDLPVSGLLAVAKDPRGSKGMQAAFSGKRVLKVYLAVSRVTERGGERVSRAQGGPLVADVPLRWLSGRQMALVAPDGRPSVTEVLPVLDLGGDRLLAALRLVTGRTHQVRAHLAHLGLPVAGDRVYGEGGDRAGGDGRRIALHAALLAFPDPATGRMVRFVRLPPPDFWECSGATPPGNLADLLEGAFGGG